MARGGDLIALGGLVALALAEVPQVMSAFLPSPSTAYDKASGGIDSGPGSMRILRRGEILGTAVSLGIATGVALIAAQQVGGHAAWIFIGAVVVLGLFLWEYERAIRMGKADGAAAKGKGY